MPIRKVAVIVDLNRDYDRRVVAGIGRYAQKVGNWSLYLEEDPHAKVPDAKLWRGHGIIADLDDSRVARVVTSLGVPVVGVGGFVEAEMVGRIADRPVPYVAADNPEIGRIGAEHLMGCELTSFGFYGLPRAADHSWSVCRACAFAARLAEAGHGCSIHTSRHRTARRWEAFQSRLTGWLKKLELPVGIMACDDLRARHVLEACRRLNLRVPQDVALLGVDNDLMMCEMSLPPLSSIEQDAEGVGYHAARILDAVMRGRKKVPPWTTVRPRAVATRRSTDFIAVEDPQVGEALQYIREHVSRPLQVTDVAEHVGLSRSTLDLRFQRALDRTVHDEIERLRLNIAKQLLTSTDLPVKQIARRTGYSNDNYMGFIFRRDLGISPGKYRQQHRRVEE